MYNYISIKQVLDDVLEHPLLKDLSLERAVNYIIHFMRIVGCPRIFEDKTTLIQIEDYRGVLPCDFIEVQQVRFRNICGGGNSKVFRHTTDSFHMSDLKGNSADPTYKIQGGAIYTSCREATIEMAYLAIATDKDGYPLIPDNSSFIRALELYIKKQCFTVLYDLNKIPSSVLEHTLQEYAWAVGQAQSDLVRLTIDQMESLTNSLNTLIQRVSEHNTGFINNGSKEYIRLQE